MKNLTDYREAADNGYIYSGFSSIYYREQADKRPNHMVEGFVLNAQADTWFRKVEGIAKGYGLAIESFKLTSKNYQVYGDHKLYKAKITTVNETFTEGEFKEDSFVFISVHEDFTIEEVLEYIENNSKNWRP